MLPYDSIEKPKIKTKTSTSYNFGDQLLGESIEKQRNGMRKKNRAIYRTFHQILKTGFGQICHTFSNGSFSLVCEAILMILFLF